jgi:hypothetical protein
LGDCRTEPDEAGELGYSTCLFHARLTCNLERASGQQPSQKASVWPPNAKLRSQMLVGFRLRGRCIHQSGRHVSGFDGTLSQMFFVDGMNFVDERQIPRASRIESYDQNNDR